MHFITIDYAREILIACWLRDDQLEDGFPITIRLDANVENLKELVIKKKQSRFTSDCELRLYSFWELLQGSESDTEVVNEVLSGTRKGTVLRGTQTILQAFKDLPFNRSPHVVAEVQHFESK